MSMVGIFTRSDRPLRWPVKCELCRRDVGVPYYFFTQPVSQGGPARYRCQRCVHALAPATISTPDGPSTPR